jgi:hypothetical protein
LMLVLGQLEFHGIGWMDGLQLAHKMGKGPVMKGRLEVLYEIRSDVPGTNITLLGCTLWRKIPESDAVAVLRKMPEFNEETGIPDWSIEKHNSEYQRDFRWLVEEVKNPNSSPTGGALAPGALAGSKEERQLVVFTAFVPDLRDGLDPWQVDASAYGTNLLDGPYFGNVKTWISGTTGRTCEFKRGEMTIVSNQRGRKGEHVTGLLKDGMSEKQKVGLFDAMRIVKV